MAVQLSTAFFKTSFKHTIVSLTFNDSSGNQNLE